MAKRARKEKTEAERAEIEADRIAAAERTGIYAEVPDGVTVIEMTPDNIGEVHNAIAEVLGEDDASFNEPDRDEPEDDAIEAEGEEKVPNSIVKDKFKVKYIENAVAQGLTSKAAKRSNWDWLSQQLATFCLSDKGKIDIGAFTDVLGANGIDHAKWANRNKGWEGRFRMTGRVALQKVVANNGVLKWPSGLEDTPVPADFIERYKTKA